MDPLPLRLRRLACRLRYGPPDAMIARRTAIAAEFLVGQGLEIGALHTPLLLPATTHARYVDRHDVADLKQQYPEMADADLVKVDIIDDGETLATLPDGSEDFVIANHVIEHCEDPIHAIENWLRVLRPGGRVFLAVPDKRISFDHRRPLTSSAHLLRDSREGPEASRRDHYVEWVRLVEGADEEQIAQRVEALELKCYSIHFHVWTPRSFREFLDLCAEELQIPFTVERFVRNGLETIVVLVRRTSPNGLLLRSAGPG